MTSNGLTKSFRTPYRPAFEGQQLIRKSFSDIINRVRQRQQRSFFTFSAQYTNVPSICCSCASGEKQNPLSAPTQPTCIRRPWQVMQHSTGDTPTHVFDNSAVILPEYLPTPAFIHPHGHECALSPTTTKANVCSLSVGTVGIPHAALVQTPRGEQTHHEKTSIDDNNKSTSPVKTSSEIPKVITLPTPHPIQRAPSGTN